MKRIKNKIVKDEAVDYLDFQCCRLFLERNSSDESTSKKDN